MTSKAKDIKFHEDIAIADTAFTVRGRTIEKLFENAAIAFTSSIAEISRIDPKRKYKINIKNSKLDLLLFDFLNELLFYKDTENLLFSKFNVEIKKSNIFKLYAEIWGEKADPQKHKIRIDIKAITMHMFELKEVKDGYKARIVVDI